MLFMILVKASPLSENASRPSKESMRLMDEYNDALDAAGVKIMAKGLHPTKEAIRIAFIGDEKIRSNGPFEPSSEQLAGFFLIEVDSKEEALDWFEKAPDPIGNGQGLIELRQIY